MSNIKKAVLSLIGEGLTTSARVEELEPVASRYRRVVLSSDAFIGADFEPGAKIQLDVGNWDLRTYTPISIDAVTGVVDLLFYVHGVSAASRWVEGASRGSRTRVTASKPSLALSTLTVPILFFGDETSLAAATTIQRFAGDHLVSCLFEADDAAAMMETARHLKLVRTTVIVRRAGPAYGAELVASVMASSRSCAAQNLVLTGNARSVQTIRAGLKAIGERLRQRTMAHWSPGKIGLD